MQVSCVGIELKHEPPGLAQPVWMVHWEQPLSEYGPLEVHGAATKRPEKPAAQEPETLKPTALLSCSAPMAYPVVLEGRVQLMGVHPLSE